MKDSWSKILASSAIWREVDDWEMTAVDVVRLLTMARVEGANPLTEVVEMRAKRAMNFMVGEWWSGGGRWCINNKL